ncbi:MAG: hypothetical protein DA408_13135 [Bacteroidetes bacterium]|nr:MAG: hypothetical protein C7N36_13655 [Bacteroidota bacterium]PTM11550.1 MAG: hypothetical protein DA408_13135 [Bacteroidota bacterium]
MPITVSYRHTPELAYDFAIHYLKSRRLLRIGLLVLVLLIMLRIYYLLSQGEAATEQLINLLFPLAMIAILWFWLIPFSMKRQIKRAHQSNSLGAERIFIFQEDELEVRAGNQSSAFPYDHLLALRASAQNYFLYISSNQALIVPKGPLSEAEDLELLDLLRRKGVPFK